MPTYQKAQRTREQRENEANCSLQLEGPENNLPKES